MRPDYNTYTLAELRDARNHIDEARYPERAADLDARIAAKSPDPISPPYYSPQFLSVFPDTASIHDLTDWTTVHFANDDQVVFAVDHHSSVTLDGCQRTITSSIGRFGFDEVEAVTVTVLRRIEMPDDVGVWLKLKDREALRICRLYSVATANRVARYLGMFMGVAKIQTL